MNLTTAGQLSVKIKGGKSFDRTELMHLNTATSSNSSKLSEDITELSKNNSESESKQPNKAIVPSKDVAVNVFADCLSAMSPTPLSPRSKLSRNESNSLKQGAGSITPLHDDNSNPQLLL